MDRLAQDQHDPADAWARRMYQRALAQWASDLLKGRKRPAWRGPDPTADFRDRNWQRLYTGSVLDD